MKWGHNGSTNGQAWIHPLSLDLHLRLTLTLPPLLSIHGAHLCICASVHALPISCRAWPTQSSLVQRVLFIPTFPWKLSLEPVSLPSTDRLMLSVKVSIILGVISIIFPMY